MKRKPALDIYQHVTDAIVAAVEADPGAFRMPWHRTGMSAGLPRNAATKKPYNGINTVFLWAIAETRHYPTTLFASYKQWADIGAQVKEGSKGIPVIFYKEFSVDPDPDDADDNGRRRTLRHSYVFNASQVDGYEPTILAAMPPLERHPDMLRLIANSGVDIRIGGDSAYYSPQLDYVQLPDEDRFRQATAFDRIYHFESTAAHELVHASGHSSRLNRNLTGRFGESSYAAEEIIADLGACMICARLGLAAEPRSDHAQYIAHWLSILKSDSRAIFTAAAKASEAAQYLTRFLDEEAGHAD